MKVVISGYYGFDNIGDEAILYAIIQSLRKMHPDLEVTVLSNNPKVTAERYHVKAVDRWKLKDVVRAIKMSDGLVSGGGSLMQDETGFRTIPYYAGIIKIAKFYRKPVFIYAQGMGPFNHKLSRLIVKNALKNTTITVRDNDSKHLLQQIGIKESIDIVPDPVLGIDLVQQSSEWFTSQQFTKPVVTVSVRDWPTTNTYKQKLAQALSFIGKQGYQIVFIPMHGTYDLTTSKEIVNLMDSESKIAPHDASIHEKIAMINESEVLIGIRLHALIFAAVVNTPFLPLSYDPKIDSFSEICGQPLVGSIEKDDWDTEDLTNMFTKMTNDLEEEKRRLGAEVSHYKEEAQNTAQAALKVFKSKKES
ncbi:polysaccharide pyruvyl transferase CsaB [Sporosarcina siberiensis]|uniref:Polysaccharide pyruvyl transferase CsaB n=1 Tax=Sporosarcina siberiensis TaxID=1365606 RepID=A0ABW4SKD8_9BACL